MNVLIHLNVFNHLLELLKIILECSDRIRVNKRLKIEQIDPKVTISEYGLKISNLKNEPITISKLFLCSVQKFRIKKQKLTSEFFNIYVDSKKDCFYKINPDDIDLIIPRRGKVYWQIETNEGKTARCKYRNIIHSKTFRSKLEEENRLKKELK